MLVKSKFLGTQLFWELHRQGCNQHKNLLNITKQTKLQHVPHVFGAKTVLLPDGGLAVAQQSLRSIKASQISQGPV